MHKKYGPIVRINPYELHIIDPEFYDELYSSNRKSDKYRWWTNLAGADGSSFSTVPHDLHRLRRGALNPFFSVRSVTQLEPLIRSKVEKLSARFGDIAQTGEVVRLDAAFMALTMDIICDYAFANDRKYLDEPDFKLIWKETIIGAFEGGAVGRQFPWMLPVMKRLPFDLPPEEKTLQRLCDEAEILTGAGSETTAQTLTRILFYLKEKGRYCYVKPGCGEKRDDAPKILDAFKKCNDGGTVVFDKSYLIGSPLDLTFLKHIDVVITGSIEFNDDPYYWADNSFKFAFQNQSVFWKLGGEDINIYGDLSNDQSVIDGRGQAYWVAIQTNSSLLRPMLFSFEGVKGATMSHLRMRNPPNWFNLIANSTDVLISNMDLRAESTNGTKIANSDGWDTYRSDRVVIQDSYIINTDDCVSFKPNSTNVVIQNLDCTGSHGISVGSLGQYKGETDIVENLYIYNITMADASDAARIKVWPGIESSFQTLLNGGGGLGRVRNVTYDLFKNINNDRAITITQCYGQKNQTLCEEHPANLTITDITLKNIYGTTSAKLDPQAGTLVCSAPDLRKIVLDFVLPARLILGLKTHTQHLNVLNLVFAESVILKLAEHSTHSF
ncbi:Exopolygalacturonase X-1 [Colletotrichum sp. SAR 10_98]|nr:Exopolygalacturonase X-1 [Colletotrichum sp. SAR 10_98]